jgi:hypothetical protein
MNAFILILTGIAAAFQPIGDDNAVVIYDRMVTAVHARPGPGDLWLPRKDLERATPFTLKPEGFCRDGRCIPIPDDRKSMWLQEQDGETWCNLSELGRTLRQAIALEPKHRVWCFGPEDAAQNEHVRSRIAPDFSLPDVNGVVRKLSAFRGKKVLLVTWASW